MECKGEPPKCDYFKVKNDWFDALIKIRLPGTERQCLDFIIRKTYGWQKKEADISNKEFCEATGLLKQNVYNSLKSLKERNLIEVIKNDYKLKPSYSFNKYFKSWDIKKLKIKKKVIKSNYKSNQIQLPKVIKSNYKSKVVPIIGKTIKDNKDTPPNPLISNRNGYPKKARAVLRYLNRKKGSRYKDFSFVIPRLKEGGTVKECIQIINNKMADEYFQKNPRYLCPETLFRKSHWDKYLNDMPHPLDGKVSKTTQQNIKRFKNWGRRYEG
jgi:phage replication O-like protein O